jgi:hypothetical protein
VRRSRSGTLFPPTGTFGEVHVSERFDGVTRSSHLPGPRATRSPWRTYRVEVRGDPSLRDQQLQDEIDLVGALVLAASQTEEPLSAAEIDEILGVEEKPSGASQGDPVSPG